MQDFKEMGNRLEIKTVAFLMGALFIMLVISFSLGVVMGKKLYGPVEGQQVAQPSVTEPTPATPTTPEPAPTPATATSPAATATAEQYRFYDLRNPQSAPAAPGAAPSSPTPATPSSPTATSPAPANPGASPAAPVTEPEPPPSATPPPAASENPAAGQWSIQTESGPSKTGAEDRVRSLKNRGFDAWVSPIKREGVTYYRVRIGHFATADEAKAEMQKLVDAKVIRPDAFVTK